MYTEVTTPNLLSTSFGVATASWSYSNTIDGKLAATLVGAFVAAIFRANDPFSLLFSEMKTGPSLTTTLPAHD